jgi:hypothetical protein
MMVKHKTPLPLLSFLIIVIASCKKGNVVPAGKDLVLTAQEQQKGASDNVFSLKLYQCLSAHNTCFEHSMVRWFPTLSANFLPGYLLLF